MHDNAPCHTAKKVFQWFNDQEVEVLLWPAHSPDLNPIEHLWEHIQRQLEKLPSTTSKSLWENISLEVNPTRGRQKVSFFHATKNKGCEES